MNVIDQLGGQSDLITFQVWDSFTAASKIREEWDALAKEVHTEIYQSFDWSRIWWNHYGAGRDLHILTFHIDEELMGVLPFFIEEMGFGPTRLRISKQVSSDYTMGTMKPVVREMHLERVISMVHRYFLTEQGCDCIRWGIFEENQPILSKLDRDSQMDSENEYRTLRVPHGVESTLHLPEDFKTYLQGLSKNHRTNFRRSMNRLIREVDFKIQEPVLEESIDTLLEEFVELHQNQWEAIGESGHFGDWPDALAFHNEMASRQSELDNLVLVRGYSGEDLLSAQYCYGFGDQLSWLLPARRMEERWSKFGLGRVGFVTMVQKAVENGFASIHLGGAYWQYKSDLGGEEVRTFSILVTRTEKEEKKVSAMIRLFQLFDKLYYKVWFKRISRWLPIKRGPLWHTWIRWKL